MFAAPAWMFAVPGTANFPRWLADRGFVRKITRWGSILVIGALVGGVETAQAAPPIVTTIPDIVGPAGSQWFGQQVVVLANGNFVVTDPTFDSEDGVDVGAVYLYDGVTNRPIRTLRGTRARDRVGSNGVVDLRNGDFVVASPYWSSTQAGVGAVTLVDGSTPVGVELPLVAVVSAANSLIGTSTNDNVGSGRVTALANGDFVVASPNWDNVETRAPGVGAVTLVDGSVPTGGVVSAANSLIGAKSSDSVGSGGVTALANGDFVVASPYWNSPEAGALYVGAVTLVDGSVPTGGVVLAANSLIGAKTYDSVGSGGVTALANGDFVVASPFWSNPDTGALNVGALTLVDGSVPTAGVVLATNSLTGNRALGRLTALANGNFLLWTSFWTDAATGDRYVGLLTWFDGSMPLVGSFSPSNSMLFGSSGQAPTAALSNGNYVVASRWSNPDAEMPGVGAVTLVDGSAAPGVVVSAANSLIGSNAYDWVGNNRIVALINGDYAVVSSDVNGGAVTYVSADHPQGVVSAANSVFDTGYVRSVSERFTSGGSLVMSTFENRLVLLHVDQPPTFAVAHPNVTVDAAPGATDAVVSFALPVAADLDSTPTVECVPASGSVFTVGSTTVACTATDSAGYTAQTSFTVHVAARANDFVPVPANRLADTRAGSPTVDGLFAGAGQLEAGSTFELTVADRGGVAADAEAAGLNVTAVASSAGGFVTVFPCRTSRPTTSNLNFTPSAVVANAVVAEIGVDGKVCLFVSGATDLVVDVNGFFPATTGLHSISPARVLDTRGQPTFDGLGQGPGLAVAGSITQIQITGRAGVPASATAAVLNLTVTQTVTGGYATVFPCGTPVPATSTINFEANATVANLAVSKISSDGKVCVFSQVDAHLIVDVSGYLPVGTSYNALSPARVLDTRAGHLTVDHLSEGAGPRPAGAVTEVVVAGRGGVALSAETVVLNVTVTGSAGPGFIIVFPCGTTRPTASNLNYDTGATVANAVITNVGVGGEVCLFNSSPTELIADVSGFIPA
jgi:hypothetical protein